MEKALRGRLFLVKKLLQMWKRYWILWILQMLPGICSFTAMDLERMKMIQV